MLLVFVWQYSYIFIFTYIYMYNSPGCRIPHGYVWLLHFDTRHIPNKHQHFFRQQSKNWWIIMIDENKNCFLVMIYATDFFKIQNGPPNPFQKHWNTTHIPAVCLYCILICLFNLRKSFLLCHWHDEVSGNQKLACISYYLMFFSNLCILHMSMFCVPRMN